jgi:DNA-directed RNA polymerase specialized sigma24 family protein
MAKNSTSTKVAESNGLEAESVLLAILALMVDERERAAKLDQNMDKTELILDSIGLSHQQIAKVLNKNTAAVRMMITRAKTKSRKAKNLDNEAVDK